ncbi:MAG: peptide/nickel transport system permease protein, partial [Polaribacter sp.]
MTESDSNIQSVDADVPPVRRKESKCSIIWRELKKSPLTAKIGLLIIFIYAFVAIFAPLLAPFGESEIVGRQFSLWTEKHWLGTDNLGRDMLTRLIYGARNTVGIA